MISLTAVTVVFHQDSQPAAASSLPVLPKANQARPLLRVHHSEHLPSHQKCREER